MIVGITGTNGAGKGTVVDYLVQKGFRHYSARAFIIAEIEQRGLPINRVSMGEIGNSIRKEHGPSFIIELLFAQALKEADNAVIESIRSIGEATFLKAKGALLFSVDADRELRYRRILQRGSHTDSVDFETWITQEEREWHNEDAFDMNVPGVMALADALIVNDGTLENLYLQIDTLLERATQ